MLLKITVVVLLSAANCLGQLDLQVSPIPSREGLPLTRALGDIALHVSDGYVLFGIDLGSDSEPAVTVCVPDSTSLGVALSQIMSQARGYTFQVASKHVIDIYPIEVAAADDVMDIQVRHFAVTNEPAMNILSRPSRFVAELKDYLAAGKRDQKACGTLGPGISSGGPGVTLELEGTTLRRVLDAVAEADAQLANHGKDHSVPVGWVHRTKVDPKTGPEQEWSFISTVPHGWERFLNQNSDSN